MDAFEQAFAFVIGHEGGYSANSADPGNWTGGKCGIGECRGTNWGISAAAYPQLDIRILTPAQAANLYRRDYWDHAGCGALSPALALLVFDAAVNNGVMRAVGWLREARSAMPAGSTATTVVGAGADHDMTLCAEFQARRLAFMAGLPTWRTFGLGWARRLCELPFQSLQMGG